MSLVEVDKCTIDRAGVTQIKVREFGSYTWTIVNFKFGVFLKCQHCYSPVFRTGPSDEYEWQFCIKKSDYNNYFSLQLTHKNLAPASTEASGDQGKRGYLLIVLLNKWGKEDVSTELLVDVQLDQSGEKQCSTTFIKKEYVFEEKNGLMHNGHLTLVCKMYYDDGVISYPCESKRRMPQSLPIRKKDDDLEKLLESERFADLDIVCKDKVFRVHKAILVARSPVFAAMFEHEMIEQTENRVDMEEIDSEIGQELLRFIYSGKVNNLEERTRELLAGANMYALQELKAMCEEVLIEEITHDNVGEMLVIADKYKADYLKQKAIDYLTLHAKDIVNTDVFKNQMKKWSPVLMELLVKFLAMKSV